MTTEERKQYMDERKSRGTTGATAIYQKRAEQPNRDGVRGMHPAFIRPKENR